MRLIRKVLRLITEPTLQELREVVAHDTGDVIAYKTDVCCLINMDFKRLLDGL